MNATPLRGSAFNPASGDKSADRPPRGTGFVFGREEALLGEAISFLLLRRLIVVVLV